MNILLTLPIYLILLWILPLVQDDSFNSWEIEMYDKVNKIALDNTDCYVDFGISGDVNKNNAYFGAQIDGLRRLPKKISIRLRNCTSITSDSFSIVSKAITDMTIVNPQYIPIDTIQFKNKYYICVAVLKNKKEYSREINSTYEDDKLKELIEKSLKCD